MTIKLGPWTYEDFDSFSKLPEPVANPSFTGGSALRRAGFFPSPVTILSDDPRDFPSVETAWKVRRAHPIYQWLKSNQYFQSAWKTFQNCKRRAKGGKLASPHADFVFLRLVVRHAGWHFIDMGRVGKRRGATSAARKSAVAHTRALLKLFQDGIRLSDFLKQARLNSLLQELCNELQAQRRKTHDGPRSVGRQMLQAFALALITDLEIRSAAIVEDIANMLGLSPDRKTCERYVARARHVSETMIKKTSPAGRISSADTLADFG